MPGWFAEADYNKDGQIELWEWRRATKPVEEFVQLDLDGDGILHPDEYMRVLRYREAEAKAAALNPAPEEQRETQPLAQPIADRGKVAPMPNRGADRRSKN